MAQAKERLPELVTRQCDISNPEQRHELLHWIKEHHPSCNVLINNAAIVHKTNFLSDPDIIPKAEQEIATNLLAPITLSKLFLPFIKPNSNPAIINITTGLVYAPRAKYPIYNATKAALHSFTQVLRIQAEGSSVQIKEVLFPAVDTLWHQGNPPDIAISAQKAVTKMLGGLAKGKDEVRVGGVFMLSLLSRVWPSLAIKMINKVE